ncbi:glycosyltransferase, partial [Alkalibacterium sp. 20]|uniref:glycosyltransferase n=1 Tax=Alkalibacterium sp. 20 TaxID=1798803 RepID=UPI000B299891
NSNILLNPTRQDSFSLVTLEAMKAGNVIISTDLYAIKEMVDDGVNGFLIDPKYRFFDENNMPNELVWNNRKKTIYSDYLDNKIIDFMFNRICYLNLNREVLESMSYNSYKKGTEGEFSERFIVDEWTKFFLRNGDYNEAK